MNGMNGLIPVRIVVSDMVRGDETASAKDVLQLFVCGSPCVLSRSRKSLRAPYSDCHFQYSVSQQ